MRSLAVIASLIAVGMSAPALAQEPGEDEEDEVAEKPAQAPHTPQKPGDKLVALLNDTIGTWKCTNSVTMPGTDKVDVPATAKISAVLEGFAYALEYATAPKGGTANKVMAVWSQDPMTGKLIEMGWD